MNNENIDFFINKYNVNEEMNNKYQKYLCLIQKYNKVMNLTGIDDEFGVYLKHYYDSLLIEKYIPKKNSIIADIGSGAGFPGIILAIYFPDNNFDLIEPLKKRCNFLEIVIKELKLNNVRVLNIRAEDINFKQYDIVTSRAVAKLNILLELAIPILKINGKFIAMKGLNGIDELNESKKALKELNTKVIEIDEQILPFEDSKRFNIVIEKIHETNKRYPRNFGQIKKNPL